MRRLRLKRTTPISLWESRMTLPKPETIVRIAVALECEPRELLEDVETPYDLLRAGKQLSAPSASVERRFTRRRRAG